MKNLILFKFIFFFIVSCNNSNNHNINSNSTKNIHIANNYICTKAINTNKPSFYDKTIKLMTKNSTISKLTKLLMIPFISSLTNKLGAYAEGPYFLKTFSVPSNHIIGHSLLMQDNSTIMTIGEADFFGKKDLFIGTFDSEGNVKWSTIYNHSLVSEGSGIIKTQDDNYAFIGTISNPSTSKDILLGIVDTFGNPILLKSYGTSDNDCGFAIEETNTGNFIIMG